MNYKAFYRKYRPSNFNEVVGQDHVVRTLVNIIKMNKISHGYLFSGPRGTGKTSVAKIFANTINCIHSEKKEDICKYCLDNKNVSLDIIELDAASNNSVNDIRSLREQVDFAPTNHPFKVYIIDEVHMLSKGAFNALLMTLEEPPKHAIFILATTDPDKIPETILSRVQRYNFKRITKNDLVLQLKFIFEKELIECDNESLHMIASLANGSLRDALSIADQISAYSNSKINKFNIIEIFGLSTIESQVELLNLITSKNVAQALKYFDNLVEKGVDISKLVVSLICLLKDYLIYKKTLNASLLENASEETLNKLNISSNNVYKILDIFLPLLNDLKYSDIPQQLVELSIIKICSLDGQLDDYVEDKKIIESINVKETIVNSINNDTNNEELSNNNIKDITSDFFASNQNETVLIEAPQTDKVQTLEKTLLHDYNAEDIANRFNFITANEYVESTNNNNDNFNKSQVSLQNDNNLVNNNNHYQKTAEQNSFYEETKTFAFKNQHTDEVINNTTNVLNLANEDIINNIEVSESLIEPQFDATEKKSLYDTNEISFEAHQNSFVEETLENSVHDTTKEFVLNEENQNDGFTSVANAINIQESKYELTQPNIVNLFVLANKSSFDEFKEKLANASTSIEEKYEAYSMLFRELKFICSANDYILVSAKEDWIINDLNKHKVSPNFKSFIAKYFGNNVHFFGITKKEYETSRELLIELKKNNNVPKPKPLIQISNTLVHNFNDNIYKETENKSKAIFGNIFKTKTR